MPPVASLRHVRKQYRQGRQTIDALHELSIDIAAGEFLALMGPSGSGKSTLLNLIGGLDRPSTGEITVAGERIDRLRPGRLTRWRAHHVGFVFQFYHLMPTLSAARNVELPLLLTTLSRAERKKRVALALELVGLSHRTNIAAARLSGGEQQRVAIARAFVADPSILLCDEPTGDLDRDNAQEVMKLLQVLNQRQKKTIVMVTHDPKAAEFASRELHLDKGTLGEAV